MTPPDTLRQAPFLVDRSACGLLRLTGETRIDLLHRMSTQDLRGMQPGEGRATILTSDIGRIIDRLILWAAADHTLALTGEGNADAIARYLLRFVFFRDDFRLENSGPQHVIFGLYGPGAEATLAATGFRSADLPHPPGRYAWQPVTAHGISATLHRSDPVQGEGWLLIAPAEAAATLRAVLEAAGSLPLSAEQFDALRIRHGVPRFGHELTPQYIPLEANLWDDVSFSKGCYIGQEIIARMESRGKLAKRLVPLHSAGVASADLPAPGSDLSRDGKNVGTFTSLAADEAGGWALAYIRTSALDQPEAGWSDGRHLWHSSQ